MYHLAIWGFPYILLSSEPIMRLKILNIHLNACAASVYWDLGDVNLGYLVLTAHPATYNLFSTLKFVEPTNVSPKLAIPDPATTSVVVLELVRTHADKLRFWQEYNNVDSAIKMVIKTIVPEVYFRTLRNHHTGYATMCSLDIFS